MFEKDTVDFLCCFVWSVAKKINLKKKCWLKNQKQ